VENYFYDFEGEPELVELYNAFVEKMKKEGSLAGFLEKAMQKQLSHQKKAFTGEIMFDQEAPKPILPKTPSNGIRLTFEDVHVLELARQLTLIEYDLYRKIFPKEFLSLSWQKPDKDIRSPNLLAMIRNFNQISGWVVTCLVQESNLKKRARMLRDFVKLTAECWKLNNYNAVFALIAGLNSSPIHRLKKTWETSAATKQFEEMMVLTSNNNSWKFYRNALHSANPPCIPYLGIYLSDLYFVEEANKTILDSPPYPAGYINMFKCRKVAEVIQEIQQYQQKPYNLKPVESVQNYIREIEILNERLSFKLSLKAEPRES